MTASSKPVFWGVMLLLVAATVEVGAYAVEFASRRVFGEPIRRRSVILREQTERIAILLDSTRDSRQVLDSALGWRYRPGFASASDHLTMQGLRGNREYDSVPPVGSIRVAAFGDSFVYGNEVSDDDAWCAMLERRSNDLEVLNYGVGGYGLDQAFLRFQNEGMALRPDVVLIGFAPDDLRRIVNVYRRFVSSLEWPLAKPRFVLQEDGRLMHVPNPLPRAADYRRLMDHPLAVRELGEFDAWYPSTIYEHPLYDVLASIRVTHAVWRRLSWRLWDPDRLLKGGVFNPRSSAFVLQVAVLRAFTTAVRDSGAVPAVVLLPDRASVESVRRDGEPVYAPLRDALREHDVPIWDAASAFHAAPGATTTLFAAGGHYSPAGNEVLAAWLARRLDSLRAHWPSLRRDEPTPAEPIASSS